MSTPLWAQPPKGWRLKKNSDHSEQFIHSLLPVPNFWDNKLKPNNEVDGMIEKTFMSKKEKKKEKKKLVKEIEMGIKSIRAEPQPLGIMTYKVSQK